ncbi:MAG TPA: ATP-binding protein [Leptospiraceae bacterium]|nr:hypothetical protein [Leptospirales bacterium]HMW61608.1 ATP-binding protein [Leptospiraceae bacterium]HMX56788.1 ATP-binding protein [Leptospiraceae bacterium]HMY47418.1 ATP-binding protein [Leptospiraceae bacterium]HMZ37075.1 ATP-binding protein [Leptospiraceae bacterium]
MTTPVVLFAGPGLDALAASIRENQYTVLTAESGPQALDLLGAVRVDFFFVAAGSSAAPYVSVLRKKSEAKLILVGNDTSSVPCDRVSSAHAVEEALALLHRLTADRANKELMEQAEGRKVDAEQRRLEWLTWKQQMADRLHMQYSAALVRNIRHSMTQGLGAGALITQVDILPLLPRNPSGDYIVPESSVTFLGEAAEALRHWLSSMEMFVEAMERMYPAETIPEADLSILVSEATQRVDHLRRIKRQTVRSALPTPAGPIRMSRIGLSLAIRELLTNAFKYSPDASRVDIAGFSSQGGYSICILNDLVDLPAGITGIPPERENEIFEPFRRLHNVYDDRFAMEEFPMGTGLTVVRQAIQQAGGSVSLFEIRDHTREDTKKRRVMAEILLPLDI